MKAEDIAGLKQAALAEAASATDAAAVETVRVKYLGRKGLLPEIMKGLKDAAPEDRPALGKLANEFKDEIHRLLDEKKSALEGAAESAGAEAFDGTRPGHWHRLGRRHPISQLIDRATQIFRSLGFTVATGPEIETVFNNFDALNHAPHHPARDPGDTFYLGGDLLLRTHTSPVQVRYMQAHPPPVRVVVPGRVYRRDTTDATHSANFHQIEGLYVNREVSLAELKGDLEYFGRQLMGRGVRARFRPHFFPFTEPSVEVDYSCHVCGGKGCRVCKQSGWIEIAGAGMVHPNVFRAVGYDPEACTGYAFGMGVERLAMILFGVHDIRSLYENDLRYLDQFG